MAKLIYGKEGNDYHKNEECGYMEKSGCNGRGHTGVSEGLTVSVSQTSSQLPVCLHYNYSLNDANMFICPSVWKILYKKS